MVLSRSTFAARRLHVALILMFLGTLECDHSGGRHPFPRHFFAAATVLSRSTLAARRLHESPYSNVPRNIRIRPRSWTNPFLRLFFCSHGFSPAFFSAS